MLAAHRVGIREILVPDENRKDVPEIPAKIRADIHFIYVKSMDEVVREALLPPLEDSEDGAPQDQKEPNACRSPRPNRLRGAAPAVRSAAWPRLT